MTDKDEVKKPEAETEKVEKPQVEEKPEKMLPQSEVTRLMEDARKKHKKELDDLETEYRTFRKSIEDKQKAAEDAAKEKVEKMRADLPEPVTKLLDKLSYTEQLDWLSDPANTIEKKTIKPLPNERGEHGAPPRMPVIV